MKLIRNESLGNKQWSSSNVNEWVGSTMQVYLNDEYTINQNSRLMISNAKYYLGGSSKSYSEVGSELYLKERGITVSNGCNTLWIGLVGLMYPSDYIYTYSLGVDDVCYNTPGKDGCNNSNPSSGWLYRNYWQWTITSVNVRSYASYVFYVTSSGYVFGATDGRPTRFSYGASPVVYLKPNVKITSGDGTINNAYKLSM